MKTKPTAVKKPAVKKPLGTKLSATELKSVTGGVIYYGSNR